MEQNKFIPFDVNKVPLEGKNLVEASAGTGKTYSIGLLMLRLLLEKNISLKEILLVTFTNAAAAELEERIRLFVRSAHDCLLSETDTAEPIKKIVEQAVGLNGESQTKQQLKDALLFLDELSVMTIHGFCMQTLTNHAFETGQLFGSELKSSMDEILTRHVQKFWRDHVTTLPLEVLQIFIEKKLSIAFIQSLVKEFYGGKRFYLFDRNTTYQFNGQRAKQLLLAFDKPEEKKEKLLNEYEALLTTHSEEITEALSKNFHGKNLIPEISEPEKFLCTLQKKRSTQYIIKILGPTGILAVVDSLTEIEQQIKNNEAAFIGEFYSYAIQEISKSFEKFLITGGILSYNDLIKNLHTSLCGDNKNLIANALKKEYKAVFIDEFQDTDKLQYEIFKTAFGSDTILFYIGDPKQSIYSFRQADVNTYLKAYNDVDHLYSMNINFRSSKKLIEAMNRFFLPNETFDTFSFGDAKEKFEYINVNSPETNSKGNLFFEKDISTPISIYFADNKPDINQQTALLVYELLTNDKYSIESEDEERKIKPSDIGILVRGNKDGVSIKDELNKHNIPAVVITEEKVMKTSQAKELYFVLQAIYDPVIQKLNTALVNSFTGYSNEDALKLNHEHLLELFKKYKIKWQSEGIYSCIASYTKDLGIKEHLTDPSTPNGLRIITNLNQLTELLFRTEYHQKLRQAELLDWLKRAMTLELVEDDESIIRLENDADAVNISTIHKSKGLQYNIVIVPHFDFVVSTRGKESISIYENGEYINIPCADLNDEQKSIYQTQQEQENRRLMYVAVTRAVFKCVLFRNNHFTKSGFNLFVSALKENPESNEGLIELSDEKFPTHNLKFSLAEKKVKKKVVPKIELSLRDTNWRFMSYSSLVAKTDDVPARPIDIQPEDLNGYDEFVFKTLRKGAITGNMLHEILEQIDFTNAEKHASVIARTVERFTTSETKSYNKYLPELLQHILHGNIVTESGKFQLSEIQRSQKLHEMEFDFSVDKLNPDAFVKLAGEYDIPVQLKTIQELQGIMNGFIDLFFEHDGKFYVLDWKSNFLGERIEDYEPQALQQWMGAFHFHLQYLLYSLAMKRFVKSRNGHFDENCFGGIIYCFVRGMREGKSSGVYFNKPDLKLLQHLDSLLLEKKALHVL